MAKCSLCVLRVGSKRNNRKHCHLQNLCSLKKQWLGWWLHYWKLKISVLHNQYLGHRKFKLKKCSCEWHKNYRPSPTSVTAVLPELGMFFDLKSQSIKEYWQDPLNKALTFSKKYINCSELIENGDSTKLQINEEGLIFPQSLQAKQVLNWRNN